MDKYKQALKDIVNLYMICGKSWADLAQEMYEIAYDVLDAEDLEDID